MKFKKFKFKLKIPLYLSLIKYNSIPLYLLLIKYNRIEIFLNNRYF